MELPAAAYAALHVRDLAGRLDDLIAAIGRLEEAIAVRAPDTVIALAADAVAIAASAPVRLGAEALVSAYRTPRVTGAMQRPALFAAR